MLYYLPMRESVIEDAILTWLNLQPGTFAFKVPDQREVRDGVYMKNKWMPRGIPDICCMLSGGRTCFIEVKNETGKLSAEQVRFHAKMGDLGHIAHVVRSLDDVKELNLY
jgi:hypothetical protein